MNNIINKISSIFNNKLHKLPSKDLSHYAWVIDITTNAKYKHSREKILTQLNIALDKGCNALTFMHNYEEKYVQICPTDVYKEFTSSFDLFSNLTAVLSEIKTIITTSNQNSSNIINIRTSHDGLSAAPITITVSEGSIHNLDIIISQLSNTQLYSVACDIVLEKNSKLNLKVSCNESSTKVSAIININVIQKEASEFSSFLQIENSECFKSNLLINLEEQGAKATLLGAMSASGEDLIDNYSRIAHYAPQTYSKQLYKNLLKGRCNVIFDGYIYVKENAQKIEAYQTNHSLILSDEATLHTKPQLEIFADDVKCSHGATVGKIDNDVMFYLKSRGLSEEIAKEFIIDAFLLEVEAQSNTVFSPNTH